MTAVAIIPARGGSKGVPHKNLAPVAGVSLLERSILACRQSERIDRILVTSDSLEILSAAQRAGAETIQRPSELASDDALTAPSIQHAIKAADLQADFLALVQCTSPFLSGEHADLCFRALDRWPAAHVAILAAEIHTVIWVGGARQHCLSQPEGIFRGRRQDQAPLYFETGACYVYRWDAWQAHTDTIRAPHTVLVGVPYWPYGVQVDTPEDLRAADMLAREWGLW
jgi:N-acylneuraminate cytidylyltransferase